MLVKELLEKIGIVSEDDREVKGISFRSKDIKEGYIFVARKGNTFNGNDYINEAFNKISELEDTLIRQNAEMVNFSKRK